jgi:tetratricopeptide (TPR) repeat protein
MRRAQAALEVRRYDEALREASLALAQVPTNAHAHCLVSLALLRLGRYSESQHAAEAGLAVAPESEWLHRLRAMSLIIQGLGNEALDNANEAVRLAPSLPSAHHVRSLALMDVDRVAEARDEAEEAVKLDPSNAELLFQLGNVYLHERPATAETYYRRSLAIDPTNAYTLNNLGVALKAQGHWPEAMLAFKSALLIDPTMTAVQQNTHAGVQHLAKVGPLIGRGGLALGMMALYIFLLFSWAGLPQSQASTVLRVSAVGVVLMALFVAYRALARRVATRRLKKTDPQLWTLYQQLDADKNMGRL